jgi:uncharacterized alkaline shock family protein YloU
LEGSVDSGGVPVSEVSLARAVVAAVRAVPSVADVSPGLFAEAATYGPGEKVRGVVVGRAGGALYIEVHICASYADSLVLPELAARVRDAVRQSVEALDAGPLRPVHVAFDDLCLEEEVSG